MNNRPKIVIIGANFAGIAAARQIRNDMEVVLIDPSPYFEFTPNIHELISGEKSPESLRINREVLIRSMGHTWIKEKVVRVDPQNKHVELASSEVINFDTCIVATGGVDYFGGVEGADTLAYSFKSVDDCYKIRQRFDELRYKRQPFSIVIVGGGSEGIEGLGELLRKYAKDIPLNIHLVEAGDRLLPQLSSKVNTEITRLCRKLPIEFHFNTKIEAVKDKKVILSDGRTLSSDLTIWTGGVRPNPILNASGLSESSSSWASTNSHLQSSNFDHIFIAGDSADLGGANSKQAYFAIETGEIVGKNVVRYLKEKRLLTFCQIERPYLYSFGTLSSFFIWKDFVLAGKPIGVLKEAVYRKTISDFKSGDLYASLSNIYTGITEKVQEELFQSVKELIDDPIAYLFSPPLKVL